MDRRTGRRLYREIQVTAQKLSALGPTARGEQPGGRAQRLPWSPSSTLKPRSHVHLPGCSCSLRIMLAGGKASQRAWHSVKGPFMALLAPPSSLLPPLLPLPSVGRSSRPSPGLGLCCLPSPLRELGPSGLRVPGAWVSAWGPTRPTPAPFHLTQALASRSWSWQPPGHPALRGSKSLGSSPTQQGWRERGQEGEGGGLQTRESRAKPGPRAGVIHACLCPELLPLVTRGDGLLPAPLFVSPAPHPLTLPTCSLQPGVGMAGLGHLGGEEGLPPPPVSGPLQPPHLYLLGR